MERVLVIGIGNSLRGDDAAGPQTLRRLAGTTLPEGVSLRECSGEPASLLAAWEGADTLILVDASESGEAPGTVTRYDVSETALPSGRFRHSTHVLGLAEAIELSRALGTLPPRAIVFAIEGGSYGHGETMGETVAAGVETAAREIFDELIRGTL